MTILIDNAEYIRSHAKAPRGFGLWMFYLESFGVDPVIVQFTGNYAAARRAATQHVRKVLGWNGATIHPLP